jgi:hypothetical protein
VRVGPLLSAAETDYPVSRHSGGETHLVVSDIAEWTIDGWPYLLQEPGTLMHHYAWVAHGRRTLAGATPPWFAKPAAEPAARSDQHGA